MIQIATSTYCRTSAFSPVEWPLRSYPCRYPWLTCAQSEILLHCCFSLSGSGKTDCTHPLAYLEIQLACSYYMLDLAQHIIPHHCTNVKVLWEEFPLTRTGLQSSSQRHGCLEAENKVCSASVTFTKLFSHNQVQYVNPTWHKNKLLGKFPGFWHLCF